MPKCKVCGKILKNPNATSHINSKFHQQKLRKVEAKKEDSFKVKPIDKSKIGYEINELKTYVSNLDKRILRIEKALKLNISRWKFNEKVFDIKELNNINIEQEIINIINQKSNLQQIKGNFTLKDLKYILLKDYKVPEKKFEESVLRLYRKQVVDLQPGGDPADYHLISPTGKKFYYLIAKN